jgi:hypothetical protein
MAGMAVSLKRLATIGGQATLPNRDLARLGGHMCIGCWFPVSRVACVVGTVARSRRVSGESLFNCKGRRTKRIGQPHRVDVYASPSNPCHSLPKINSSSTDRLYEKRRRHHRFQAGNAEFMLLPKRREADCTSGQSTASAVVRGFRLIPTWTWTCMF